MVFKASGISIDVSYLHPDLLPHSLSSASKCYNVVLGVDGNLMYKGDLTGWFKTASFKAVASRDGCRVWLMSPSLSPPMAILRLPQYFINSTKLFSPHFKISELRILQSLVCLTLAGNIYFFLS